MLPGLEGRESRVMPDLVHRLFRWSGGLVVASDCITRPFWVPITERLMSPFRAESDLMSRDAPTGHKLFNFISTSLHPRRWAHIKRSAGNKDHATATEDSDAILDVLRIIRLR